MSFVPSPADPVAPEAEGVRTVVVHVPREPNRVLDTAELLIARARAVPRNVRLAGAGAGSVFLLALLIMVVLHPFDASKAAPQQTARPAPTPPGPTALINAFFGRVRDPQAAFHVTVTGDAQTRHGATTTKGRLRASIDVGGEDLLSGELHSKPADPVGNAFNGLVTRMHLRSWTRAEGTSSWDRQQLPVVTDVLNPFVWIATTDEVSFVRDGTASGEHRSFVLRVDKWLNGAQYDAFLSTLDEVDREGSMQVDVDEHGTPMQATYRYSLSGTASGGDSVTLTGTLTYTFDHWGDIAGIEPPS
jgi:hypothetical protein